MHEITLEQIKLLKSRYDNITAITESLKRKIGHENKKLNNTVTTTEAFKILPTGHTNDYLSVINQTKHTVTTTNGHPYFVDKDFNVEGVNQHIDNPYLYLAIAPDKITPLRLRKVDSNLKTNRNWMGADYFKRLVNRVSTQHPDTATLRVNVDDNQAEPERQQQLPIKNINLLVLGSRNLNHYTQDPERYVNTVGDWVAELDADATGFPFSVPVFFMDTPNNKISLQEKNINFLYTLYSETLAKCNPLIIQSEDGLERAPMIAFAFQLLKNFDYCFLNSKVLSEITERVYEVYDNVRRSRSPEALSNLGNFTQAIHLAFALKMRSYEINLIKQLGALVRNYNEDPAYDSRMTLIKTCLTNFSQSSCEENFQWLGKLGYGDSEVKEQLTTYPDSFRQYFSSFFKPDYYSLLKTLHTLFENRGDMEGNMRNIFKSPSAKKELKEEEQSPTVGLS